MKKSFLVVFFAVSSLLMADVSISSASFQEKKIGKETKWVKATRVVPSTKVRYVNTISNNGAELATNLVVTNAIPKHMKFVASSAKCDTKCDITYSLDGKNFDIPTNLIMVDGGKKRVANANEYKAIKWNVKSLNAKQKDALQYEAILD
jgi:uncharacterized repeat protein (TIGR01451 family)